jgi:Mitochondrial ribosomal death-associated protein 3
MDIGRIDSDRNRFQQYQYAGIGRSFASSSSSSSSNSDSLFRTNWSDFGFLDGYDKDPSSSSTTDHDDGATTMNDANANTTQQNEPTEEEEKHKQGVERLRQIHEQREHWKKKTGRGWTDPWDIDALVESGTDFNGLLEWAPEYVSRVSQERVQIYRHVDVTTAADAAATELDRTRTVPMLTELATLPLPLPPPPNPELHMKAYALHRKRYIASYIMQRVVEHAEPKIQAVLALQDWHEKQDAVDIMFEQIELTLRDKEPILGKQPLFGTWVERALESYLKSVQTKVKASSNPSSTASTISTDEKNIEQGLLPVRFKDDAAVPIFIDCYNGTAGDTEENPVPNILNPMKGSIPLKPMIGKMVEEWELSAHKTTKRIMLRQCTRQVARAIVTAGKDVTAAYQSTRILVHGTQGTGKTATLAAIVACARTSGAIVLFLPDGNQMHQNGFYVEPNDKRKGVYDLPVLTQGVCRNLVEAHESDLQLFDADATTMETYFTDTQLGRIKGYDKGTSINLVTLLNHGIERTDLAPMCYAAAVHVLMQQEQKSFIMVMDEYNCFFMPGHYFHQKYDKTVVKAIPYNIISLFAPILNAMGITAMTENEDEYRPSNPPVMMKRGAVIVGTTESHAVSQKVTNALLSNAKKVSAITTTTTTTTTTTPAENVVVTEQEHPPNNIPSLHMIEVPRLSTMEVQHMLSNYEATGIGELRLDRGATVMNSNEVAYLHMVSGGIPQHLMNACML